MKKRSFLIFLAAGALMLAGCGKKPSSSSSGGQSSGGQSSGGEQVDVLPTEGKTTFYFTLGADSVAIPSYASIFLTGGFIDWAEPVGQCIEMQLKEGTTNVYVGMVDEIEAASTAEKYYDFQLTMGYNATSGAPSTGVNWGYKSVECAAAGGESGMDNLHFEFASVVNLGTHNWTEAPADPAASSIHNLKIEAKFAAAVPEYVDLYLVGDHMANWNFEEATKLTPNEGRTVFTQVLETVIGNTYGVKLMAQYAGQATDWNHCVLDNGEGGNYNLLIKKTWGDNYTLDLAAQAYDNLIIDSETFNKNWDEFMPALGEEVDVSVKLSAAAALEGSWEARGSWVADWSEGKALSANEGKTEFTVDLGSFAAGNTIQFKLKLADTWKVAIGDADGENIQINVAEEDMLVVVALDETLTAEVNTKVAEFATSGDAMADYTAHAAISGNGSAPAFVPADHTYGIVGIADDWDNDIPMVANDAKTEWTASIEYTETTSWGFQIRLDGKWDVQYGNLYLKTNPGTEAKGNITLAVGSYTVTLTFTAELVPVIDVVAA